MALKRSPIVVSNPAEGVVVRRNVVIDVGAGQPPVQGTAAASTAAASARAKSGAPLTAREGSAFVVGSRPRPATGAADAQPLASARDIRMPWETPAARRAAQVAASAAPVSEQAPASTSGKIRMPWDPPGKASEGLASEEPRRGHPRVSRRRSRTRAVTELEGLDPRRATIPASPSTRTRSPSDRAASAPTAPTTAGMPRSRACAAT